MINRITILCLAVLLFSCSNEKRVEVKDSNLILGLASTVSLPVEGPAKINLADFVLELELLDSVSVKAPFKAARNEQMLELSWAGDIPAITELKLWSDGIPSSIILLKSKKKKVELTYSGEAESVQVAAEFT
ncbi:MAG: hypothetical protein ACI9CU_002590, partial [Polaribacter sp.]